MHVDLTLGTKCGIAKAWDAVLKVYDSTGCTDRTCAAVASCHTAVSPYTETLVAPAEGWYTIVVDGKTGSAVNDDSGTYTLTVKLTCKTGACEC